MKWIWSKVEIFEAVNVWMAAHSCNTYPSRPLDKVCSWPSHVPARFWHSLVDEITDWKIGPYYGQAVWFANFAPEKIEFAVQRYRHETLRVSGVFEEHLEGKTYLVGEKWCRPISLHHTSSFVVLFSLKKITSFLKWVQTKIETLTRSSLAPSPISRPSVGLGHRKSTRCSVSPGRARQKIFQLVGLAQKIGGKACHQESFRYEKRSLGCHSSKTLEVAGIRQEKADTCLSEWLLS